MGLIIQVTVYVVIVLVSVLNLLSGILNYKNRNKDIPSNVKDVYDAQKYQEWSKYNTEKFRLSMIKKTTSLLIDVVMLASGFYIIINNLINNIGIEDLLFNALIFLVIFNVLGLIISLPFDYYNTFIIEEKYGFNKTTKSLFFKDQIKKFIISTVLISAIFGLLLYFYITLAEMFIVYASGLLIVLVLIFMILYTKVFSKLSNKFTPLEEGSLRTKIEEFATKVNFDISDISVMDGSKRSKKGNAYCSGFGKFKRIVLFDTLIKQCSEEEIVAILAHEIGHSKHKHQLKMIPLSCLSIILNVIILFLFLELEVLSTSFGFDSVNYGFAIIMFFVCISPISILTSLFMNKISRKHEYQADKYAALNYDKNIMINSLKTISRENFVNLTPHKLTVLLEYSHPPMHKRIEAIEKL